MEKSPLQDLISAIRAGDLGAVTTALDSGADADAPDDHGILGLPLRIAAFNGHLDIIRELVTRGAKVNPEKVNPLADNLIDVASRGAQKETVRLLIEFGANIPPGVHTGLSLLEVLAAQGVANRSGRDEAGAAKSRQIPPPIVVSSPRECEPSAKPTLPTWMADAAGEVEQIDLKGCAGVDTNALNDDVMRLAGTDGQTSDKPEEPEPLNQPALDFASKFKFWKK